ncbi:MAG: tetratricopeptide repeat protein [Spirochaetota bacterium]
MKKGISKYYHIAALLSLFCFVLPGVLPGKYGTVCTGAAGSVDRDKSFEKRYVAARIRGDVKGELEILRQWIPRIGHALVMEVALWRVYECTRHYSLIDSCLEELNRAVEKNDVIRGSSLLSGRAMHLQKRLLISSGEPEKAASICRDANTIIYYKFKESNRDAWMPLKADPAGLVDLGSLNGRKGDNGYEIKSTIYAEKDKKVYLGTGSTGRMIVHVNGKMIFHDKSRHEFCEDQHIIPVSLNKGDNLLRVKMYSSYQGTCSFSMRILSATASNMGNEYSKYGVSLPNDTGNEMRHPAIVAGDDGNVSARAKFYTGYCHYRYGFHDSKMEIILAHSARSGIAPALCHFYTGNSKNTQGTRLQSLYEAARMGMPEGQLAFTTRALQYGMGVVLMDGADPMNFSGSTPYAVMTKAWLYYDAELYYAAINELLVIEEELLCNDVHYLSGKIYADMNKNRDSSRAFMRFIRAGGFKPEYILSCAAAQKKAGLLGEAESLLVRGIRCFPHSIDLYVELCILYRDSHRLTMALGTILAARKKSPWNEDVRHHLGIVLGMLGHEEKAERYLRDVK